MMLNYANAQALWVVANFCTYIERLNANVVPETKSGLVLHHCSRYSVPLLNLEIHCDVIKFIMA